MSLRQPSGFPTDEMTLRLLIEACEINPDTCNSVGSADSLGDE